MSKRLHPDSHEPWKSVKRYSQDHPETAARLEAAHVLFRQAGEEQWHQQLIQLLVSDATAEEIETFYSPFFKDLARTIIGRDDIPVPPADPYAFFFRCACDPVVMGEKGMDMARSKLIDYITSKAAEDEKSKDNKRPHRLIRYPSEVRKAVKTAWQTEYVGKTDELLREAIKKMDSNKPYGNFCSIIQGSGTGKSRLVDKLAESILAIPMNLRPADDKLGFPLGDVAGSHPLVNFFRQFEVSDSDLEINSGLALDVQRHYLQFLLKLIAYVDHWIDNWTLEHGPVHTLKHGTERIAAEWRTHLGPPRSSERLKMYTQAIDQSSLIDFRDVLDEKTSYNSLQQRVQQYIEKVSAKLKPKKTKGPAILFYFDEAHHLTKVRVTADGMPLRTAYQCLCKAFTYMVGTPVFALFLSTYSRLSEFAPSKRNFWSSRPDPRAGESDDNINAPFVELPFDAWKEPTIVKEGRHSLQEICSLKFKARFGRPLFWTLYGDSDPISDAQAMEFAMSKLELRLDSSIDVKEPRLSDKELLPLLAARIDLTFESNRDEAVLLEGLLVASSMRTVYSVPQHRQYLCGGYSSEPFLGEAAARAIFEHFQNKAKSSSGHSDEIDEIVEKYKNDIPDAIKAWFNQGLINKGARGELVARMLLTLAHDIAIMKSPDFSGGCVSFNRPVPVVDFLRALISKEYIDKVLQATPSNLSGETLEKAFEGAYVHFSQFVKAGDKSAFTDEAFYTFLVRAAAVQGHDNMIEADLGIPICLPCKDNPNRWCMTLMLLQFKNCVDKQFIAMDAQKTFNFFTASTMPADKKRPYITIAMELGVLAINQKKARQPTVARGRNKKSEGKVPEQQKVPQSVDEVIVNIRDRELLPRDVKKTGTHPRYEIIIRGCSKRVYNVVGDVSYSGLLAHKDLLAEHPRTGIYIAAVKRMKPYWEIDSSYYWAGMMSESRVGAPTFDYQDDTAGAENDSDNCVESGDEA